LDLVVGEQIGGLEVAVQHIMRVAVRQPFQQLSQLALHLQEQSTFGLHYKPDIGLSSAKADP